MKANIMEKIANNICMYKVELMVLAIICIMMFHMAVPVVLGIKPLLQIGVDLFLFLSAFTCVKSYLPIPASTICCFRKCYISVLFVYGLK